jgi:hypothetical protein
VEVVVVKNGRPGLPREVRVRFWDGIRAGLGSRQAAVAAGISHPAAWRLMQLAGGVAANGPRAGTGRRLCLAEREEIALARERGESVRAIARDGEPGGGAERGPGEVPGAGGAGAGGCAGGAAEDGEAGR